MDSLPQKKWYQKKKVFIPALLFAGMVLGSGLNGDHATTANLSSTQEKSVQGAQNKVQGPSVVTMLPTEKLIETPAPTEVPRVSPKVLPTSTPAPSRKPVIVPTKYTPKAVVIPPSKIPATEAPVQQSAPVQSSGMSCDCSLTCTQMTSCSEAQYQLNTCGCSARDGDHDGIACDGAPLHCQN